MHDKGQQSSAGAIVVIAVVLVVLLLIGGLVVVGGLGFFFVQRGVAVEQVEVARAEAEMARAMALEEMARAEAVAFEAQREVVKDEISESPARFTIQLDQAGQILLDGHQLDRDALTEKLKAALVDEGGELKVIIEADQDCPFQNAAAITTVCLEVGIRDVGITVADEGSVND